MTIAEFVKSLAKRRVELSLTDGQIRYHGPSEALDEEVLTEIRDRKSDLIDYLGRAPKSPPENLPPGTEPLSVGQEALWFLYELDRQSIAYNTVFAARMRRDLDIGALQAAIDKLTERHDGLRSRFATADGKPFRTVTPPAPVDLQTTDVTGWSPAEVEEAIAEFADIPFDLEAAPPVRWHLFTGVTNGTLPTPVLAFVAHHITVDFRSLEILMAELSSLYRAGCGDQPAALPPLPWAHSDYVDWSRKSLAAPAGKRAEAYWLDQLEGELPALDLPTDAPRPPRQNHAGATRVQNLDPILSQKIKDAAQRLEVTPYVLLLGIFGLLMRRYSGQREILIGSPMLGRTQPELKDLVGYFVNPVILRLNVTDDLSAPDYLSRLRDTVLGALEHQSYPFPLLVERLQPERDTSRSPLFQVAFVYERETGAPLLEQGLFSELLIGGQRGAVFDLTLTALDREEGFRLTWEYASALFEADTILRMEGHFERLLEALLDRPEQPLQSLPLLSEAEAVQIRGWNKTDCPVPPAANLVEMIADKIAACPDAVALESGEAKLSYAELDARACRLARHLQERGVGANSVVAIALPRSAEQLVAVLAVLRADGTCLPVDPEDPAERIHFLLRESEAAVLLTDPAGKERMPEDATPIVTLYPDDPILTTGNAEAPACPAGPEDLVYVLFTSGSTGRPKGVAMPHRALVNLTGWQLTQAGLEKPARTLQYTPLTFDVAFQEIASTWCSGGTLVLIDEARRRDGRALLDWIESRNVERAFMPFVALQHLAESAGDKALPASLRDIVTAGEQLRTTPAIRAIFQRSACRLHNHYGPAESHVATTYSLPVNVAEWDDLPPIGRPIGNVAIHLLDEAGQPVPVGVPGELYIAGPCLAEGYLKRPDLTAERFVEHPEHGRVYRTGDFARWRSDGLIDYLGRRDDQVKLRGVRVELGEIEAVLSGHPAVGEAAVILSGNASSRRLAAYVAPSDGATASNSLQAELMDHLRANLSAPMVPGNLTLLPELPKTSSGKLDRRALPKPSVEADEAFVAPRNEAEALLAEIWSDLLGHDRVGVTANFFDLGGHSLIAMRLITRLRDSFDVDLPLSALFEAPTIAGLAERIEQLRGGERLPPISHAPDASTAPLSFAQRRLWFLEQLEGPSATYNMPATLELRGSLDTNALGAAARALVARHTGLRSRFPSSKGDPVAEVIAPYDPLRVTDLTSLPAFEREAEAQRLARSHGSQPFDLSEGPLFRLHLLQLDDRTHWLLFNIHHIVSDGWTIDILVRDISALYRAETQGAEALLTNLPVSYGDFARWQNDWLQGEPLTRQLDHWTAELDGAPTLLELQSDRPHPKTRSYRGGLLTRTLDADLTAKIRGFNRTHGATDFMTLISAFGLLLSRYSGQHDLLIGSPVANRRLRECEDLAGMFVNTLALRWRDDDTSDFAALVAETRRRCLLAYANQDLPFELLVDHLQPERSLMHSPLFQVMFVMQNAPLEHLVLDGVETCLLAPPVTVSKFDLTLYVEPSGDGFVTRWEYNADIFDEARIQRMAGHFEQLLRSALADPEDSLDGIELLTKPERRDIACWRDGPEADLDAKTLVHAIEEQAALRPNAPALVDRRESLDYAEVNASANQLAHYLNQHGIGRGDIVALCLEPGPEAVVALLGIVKSSAAYLPLDPAYPADRLDAMLSGSKARFVLSTGDLADRLPSTAEICRLDAIASVLAEESIDNPATRPEPGDLLYVIYTSGSTGAPKGAGVYHRGFANLLQWYCTTLDLGEGDRGLLVSALGFDLTQKNLFAPLIAGAALHFPEPGIGYDPAALLRTIAEDAITWINCTPSAFYPLLAGDDYTPLSSLRHIILGGEPIQTDRLRDWLAAPTCQATVLNSYGPTECTDVAVAGPLDPASDAAGVPLGRPIDNVRVLLLDPNGAPVPEGLPGELFIGGIGVGAGYLGRPDLTGNKFIDMKIDGRTGRYYATGDLACWRDDGTLDYLGRRDQQIKLRGFRIELEEIETALRADPRVKDAAVVVSQTGAQEQLVGYLAADAELDPEELRPALERRLPAYMVPSRLIRLDGLPITPNGKLDRRALASLTVTPRAVEPPRGKTERVLSEIWAGLLGLDEIDREANFFSIGGHSLLAVQLLARVTDAFRIELSLRELFEKPTLAGLASLIETSRNRTKSDISPLPDGEHPEPSFAQQRLMFLDQLEGPSTAYSMPAALELRGNLDRTALRHALAALVTRHDSLRLCFSFEAGRPVARYLDAYDPLTELDLSDRLEEDAETEALRLGEEHSGAPFDLATGPLFRLKLITLAPERHRLLFNMHHIISDGWSIDLLIADLARLYATFRAGSEAALPASALNYSSYARWQNQRLRGETLERALTFWRDHLAGAPELLDLPTDHPRPAVQVHEGGVVPLRIDAELGGALRALARENDATLFMVLLAAYDLLLSRFSGERDISVGVPVANRGDSRLEDIVGLFLNTLVMRAEVPRTGTFRDFLSEIRQATLAAYAHQDVPFEYLVEQLRPSRSLSHNPLFQVMINLVNTRREQITLDGLEIEQTGQTGDVLAKFDLNLSFTEQPDGSLDGELQYNAALFEHETAAFLGDCFLTLLRGITAEPDAPLTELSLYRDEPSARREMPKPAGSSVRFGSIERSIPDRFADQVAMHHDRIAVRTPTQSLTYGALDRESRRLAAALLEHPENRRVALLLPHDTNMAIGILGSLQAGRTYVPLDPSQPQQRLRTILEDVGAEIILCTAEHEELAAILAGAGRTLISLDRLDQVPATGLPDISPDSVAYLLYTSGSTGRPKGVVQNHRNVLHFIRRYSENLRLTSDDRLLQVASYAFDAAVMDFYGALLNGATLCLFDARNQSIADCAPWLEQEGVTVWHSTPSVFRAFTADLETRLPSIRLVAMGGEAVTRADFETFRQRFEPGALFVNGLGPTESTVTLQFFANHGSDLQRSSVPVGYPVDGTMIELLDESGAPTDLFGEIAICSPHVALGYWQQESAAFEADPARPGATRYRSGDMARRLPDGCLEMVGRRDGQIKLRGFRIELGEIEAVLRDHPESREAAAILYTPEGPSAEPRLVAYLTGMASPETALAWCRERLPSYMVPSEVMVLDALPLTVTGKLDRHALPVPEMASKRAGAGAPATPGEELLAGLWADVLKTGAVGRSDNFFDLGGHSLLATQLLSRIRAAFGADIALRQLFEHPTLSAQAAAIEADRRGTPPPPIVRREDRDTLPLSFAQQRLWFLAELEDGEHAATYNITAALGLDAALDETALRSALTALTARHDSLRMIVRAENGQPVLGLRDPYDPLLVEDLISDGEDRDNLVRARAALHAAAPFDLASDPLLRLTLLRLDANAQVLLVNLHHIAADGWSLGVLVRDLSALYAQALKGEPCDLPPLPIQYADYAAWQRDWLSGEVLEAQLSYWRDRLENAPALLELPADHSRPAVKSYRGGQRGLTLPPELTEHLEAFSRAKGATLFMTLLAAFKVLLHRYSGSEDILVGSPIANRTQAESEELVGFFVNTLVMRSTIERTQNFDAVLSQLRETALDAYVHQDLPFETLVTELQPERSLSHSPLFQVMFALQNAPQEALALGEATIQPLQPDLETAKFDLTLSIDAGSGGLACNWEYAADLFEPSRIDRMAAHYRELLESILEAPEAPVGTLPLLTPEEGRDLEQWSGGESPYPRDAALTELFVEMVQAAPDATALRFGEIELSYEELDARTNRLAAYIAERFDPSPGAVIGLCLPRGVDLIVAMLATLKTGAAYLPLDPDLPADRLGYMLEEAEVGLVLSHEALADVLPEGGHAMLLLDRDADQIDTCDADVPTTQSDGGSLAYVMYTSGSTGRPKGVIVPQRAVTRLVRDTDYIDIKPGDRIAQAATPVFDAATFEIWGALLNGAAIELLQRDDILDTERFAELLREKRFTILFLTTALFNRLAQIDAALFSGLDTLLFGGEAVDPRWVGAVLKAGPPKRLLHVYGPTECTTYATWHEVRAVAEDAASVPIGGPLANTTAHILDPDGQPVPRGIAGELHLGGDGLADGYLAQLELTEERFITHPTLGRLYRTGDLCRWNQDGAIDYLGRTDHQIKLRGFRIELGEIEAALRALPAVEEAVAILAGDGEHRRIVAYVTGTGLDGAALRRELQTALPSYMVPSEVMVLDALPLTVTGKLDRKALPVPDMVERSGSAVPATPGEELLAGLWADVLKTGAVGRSDNFFDLGGHSLLATQLLSRIRAAFGADIALRLLFEHPTLDAQTAAIERERRGTPPPPIVRRDDRDTLPLSFAQQRLWFLAELEDGEHAATYNITAALGLTGALDEDALRAALTALTARHESLRMTVRAENGQPVQVLRDPYDPLLVEDLTCDEAERDDLVRARAALHAATPFDLAEDPLLRLTLLRLDADAEVLLVNLHHIAADGWSLGVLVRDLSALYAQALKGESCTLPPLPIQYADYAAWQRDWLSGDVLETQLSYWRDRLGDAPSLLELPADRPRPAVKSYRGGQRALTLEPELAERLEAFSRTKGATLFMTLLAAFKVLLHRYSGQEDILVGSPIANRTQAESEELVGFFVNTLVMRSTIARDLSFDAVLSQLRETALDGYVHQDLPFESLVTELQPERSLSHSPLFQVMFALQNAPQEALALGDATIQPLAPDLETAKFDLTLSIDASSDGLTCNWEYAADLFEPSRIDRMAAHYRILLESILAAPEAPVGTLPLLTRAERDEIANWSGGESPYRRDAALTELFGEMVQAAPDATALRFGEIELSYEELDARANRLAAYIAERFDPAPGAVIGLCLPRGVDLILAMLATLKTGAAYLPLDPDLPADRLGYMLEEAEVGLVLSHEALADVLPEGGHAMLLLDRDADQIDTCDADVPAPQSDGSSLAYIMYTSGSTGRPKGVMVPQRAVTRLVRNTDYIDIKPGDRIAQAATPVFDAATFEIWGALLNGAAIELLQRDDILDTDRFAALLREGRFNTMFLTATLFNRMAQIDPSLFAALDTLLVGGEALDPRWIRAVLEAEPPTRLLNGYGPTECTTFAVCHHITEVPEDAASIPIGHPIANTVAHILDPDGNPVPAGIAGELHLGGDGLAEGYLAQPKLTEERFVTHSTLGRLYRTGDLCRWNQHGAIDYLGRTDHQIKLRGFRIELGEIEAALRAMPAVEEAVAILAGEGEYRRIIAYVTGEGLDGVTLRREMQTALPSYMVPSEMMVLDALPLTVTGKLDRRALPEPDMVERSGSGVPATPGEELLAGLWADVLKTGDVGRSDNFFDLGGHSLLATQLLSRIRTAFGADIALRLLFEHPTLDAQAAAIERERRGTPPPPIVRRDDRDTLPLSFAQQRLWFLAELEPDNPFYNTPLALRLTGQLDKAALKQTIDQLVARHEVLRTAFRNAHGEPVQVILDHLDVPLQEIDLTGTPVDARETAMLAEAERAARAPFTDLGAPPLLRAELVIMGPEEHVLLLTVHHIIIDGWSLNVLTRELAHAYKAHLHGAPEILPPLPVQYADFAAWQRDWLRGDVLEQQLSYWRGQLADAPPMLSLPTDRPRPAVQSFQGASLRFTIDAETRDRLKELSRTHNATLFMTLLAGFATLLYRYSGQDDIVIGSPIANRTQAESEELVGFFVNTLSMRVKLSGTDGIPELLDQVRQTALDAYAHQDLPFEHLVDELQPDRDLSRNPVFQVMMALQNMPLEQSEVEGLQLSPVHIDRRAALFDLVLDFWDMDDGLQGVIEYNRDLFDHDTVKRMVGHLTVLLRAIAEAPETRVDALPLMEMDERAAVLALSNGPDIAHPVAQSFAEAFEHQVSASPERVAAEAHGIRLDYAELNRRANRLANLLIAQDIAPGDPVAILVPRGLDYLASVLGIIKAGGMFLPLDTAYPGARLRHMLEDSNTAILVADGDSLAALAEDGLPETVGDVILVSGNTTLDDSPAGVRLHMASALSAQTDENPPIVNGPRDPLYLLYTSGSTGRPKGALVRHEGALNHIFAEFRLLDFGADGAILQSAPASSDISVWQCLGPLLVGGRVVCADFETVASPRALLSLIRESRVSLIELVPVVLESLMNEADGLPSDRRALPDLTSAMVTGESVSVSLVNRWLSLWPDIPLINAYGPTEAADDVCQSVIDKPLPAEQVTVPIGMPVDNISVFILDASLELQPIGVPGEICVSGIGVGDGYWRRPELTAEVFVDNPHSDHTFGMSLYRTGDLGRRRPDGTLDYLGRIDGQVKIRGFRVELGEIEAAIAHNPQIREVLVQDYLDAGGERRLAAYLQVRMPSAEASELVQDQVALWKELHEASYADESVADEDATFNTIGWDSTFTGEPLSAEEMRECVDNAISRILEAAPKHLLEIGCGTGLLLYRLVPECESYLGTDLSAVAIEQLRVRQNRLPVEGLSRAELRAQTADDFQGIAPGSFDTLVLNSVIQYFPNHDYLLTVLREAVERCADGGTIFVGDVRSLPLLRGYHSAVQCFKAEPDLTLADLSERIEDHLAREQELSVAPALFELLGRMLPRVSSVEIWPKRGAVHNEMTCFRYDVVIHVGTDSAARAPIDWEDWRTDCPGLDEIQNRLETRDGLLALRNIPNARLDEMRSLLDWLDEEEPADTVEAARKRMQAAAGQGLDPEALWRLQETLPVTVEIFWEPESDCGELAVLVRPKGHAPIAGAWSSLIEETETPSSQTSDDPFAGLTNNPLSESFTRHLLPRLRQELKGSLPEHMIPSGFVVMDRFPLMPNGKVDRQALPTPRVQTLASGMGSAPATPTETAMQEIWAEVLGIAPPGTEDNFFELGGHSLKATQVLSRLQDRLRKELTLRDIFNNPTIAALSELLDQQEDADAIPIAKLPDAEDYPVSYAQQRLWFLSQMDGGEAYHMVDSLRVRGPLDVESLRSAFGSVIARHESLRTSFIERDGTLRQRIDAPGEPPVEIVDLSDAPDPLEAARERALADAGRGFDLTQAPLIRLHLLRLGADDHVLLFNMHHIVSDGWSMDVLVREVVALYRAETEARNANLPPLLIQHRDYVAWQSGRLAKRAEEHRDFWRDQLGDLPPPLDLPTDFPRPPVKTYNGGKLRQTLDAGTLDALNDLARAHGTSLFMVLTALVKTFLHRISGADDISIGVPAAGRGHVDLEHQIGFFVNTLVLRDRMTGAESFSDILDRVRRTSIAAYAHEDYPFDEIVRDLNVPRDPSRNPLFDVMVAFQNTENVAFDLPGLEVSSLSLDYGTTQFDQLWSFTESETGLQVELRFNRDLFEEASISRQLTCWMTLVESALETPHDSIGRLPLLTPDARSALLARAVTEIPAAPPHQSLTGWFEAQAEASPDAIAVSDGETQLSYAELNRQANRLAHRLSTLINIPDGGAAPLIGLCMPRSPELIVGMLAILKAGGAYLPLDPNAPAARLDFILKDAQAPVLVTWREFASLANEETCALCLLDEPNTRDTEEDSNPDIPQSPDRAAYVIYTSGSTGQPKGTVITHANAMRLFTATDHWFGFGPEDVWTLFHSFAFDFSVWESWGALLHGGRLVIVPYDVSRAPDRFLELLEREQVTVLNQTPSAFRQLLQSDPEQTAALALRYVIFGGEALDPTMLRPWFERRGDRSPQLVNMYGITETTVHVTYRPLSASDAGRSASLIGEPIPDLQLYVLNDALEPVPDGIPGELLVGGDGLAAGYLHRPDLTAERFIENPFRPGERLYRTGDKVRRRNDGELEYLGRLDNQVKIRGFRIELGEISACLDQHPDVREAAVTIHERDGDKSLVGYYVPHEAPPNAEDLRRHLQAHLPAYMVPSRFIALDHLPLTINGKLDYRALPDLETISVDEAGRAPGTEMEEQVLSIWRELLGHPGLGVEQNVFEHGAHSVLAVRARARIQALLGRELNIVLLFQHPTPAALAAALEASAESSGGAKAASDGTDRAAKRRGATRGRRTSRNRGKQQGARP